MAGTALAFGYVLGWIPMWIFRVEVLRQALPYYGGSERLAVQWAPIVIGAHVALSCIRLNFGPFPAALPLAAGAAIHLAAVGFWFWGRTMIGPLRLRRLPQEPPLQFRRDGAFAVVRHPLYTSYVAAALAPVVATGDLLLAATFTASFFAINVRAAQEERRLHQQLGGDYESYCRRVKRLIPLVW